VAANLTARPATLSTPLAVVLLSTAGERPRSDPAVLAPWEAVITARDR